jgi:hypothetical protein
VLALQQDETVQVDATVTAPRNGFPGFRELQAIVKSEAPITMHRSIMFFVQPSVSQSSQNAEGLPHGGVLYGNPIGGESSGNSSKVIYKTAVRFRAEKTGTLSKLQWHNRTIDDASIKERCESSKYASDPLWCNCYNNGLDRYTCGYITGNMYSVGNGGLTELTIQTDDGTSNHFPSGNIIGRIVVPSSQQGGFGNPNAFVPVTAPWYVTFDLDRAVQVQAGQIYHIVMHNLRPPVKCTGVVSISQAKSCDRDRGSQGLNGMAFYSGVVPKLGTGPYYGHMVTRKDSEQGGWFLYNHPNAAAPWYVIQYSDGDAYGNVSFSYEPYNSIRYVGGNNKVRERFTVAYADRNVNGLWVRAARKGGTGIGALTATLQGGGVNMSASIPASSITQSQDVFQKVAVEWAYIDLPQSVVLKKGTEYTLTFSAPSGADYWFTSYIQPNLPSKNSWDEGLAEYTTGGAWTRMRTDGWTNEDISVAFTIVGQPKTFGF